MDSNGLERQVVTASQGCASGPATAAVGFWVPGSNRRHGGVTSLHVHERWPGTSRLDSAHVHLSVVR